MTDAPAFNAIGVSERDRLTRLETLQQVDALAMASLQKDIRGLDAKLDMLLAQRERRAAVVELGAAVFKPAGTLIWGAIMAFGVWAVTTYLNLRGTH